MRHGIYRYRKGCRCKTCRAANRARAYRPRCRVCGNPTRRMAARPTHLCGFCIADLARLGWVDAGGT